MVAKPVAMASINSNYAFMHQKIAKMKRIFFSIISLLCAAILWNACDTYKDYPGGVVSPYISIYDVRQLHKDSDVTLTVENMDGSTTLAAMVVSIFMASITNNG